MSAELKRDWAKTWIHGVCGFFVGAAIGFCWVGEFWGAIAGALVIGLVAAIWLDDFWKNFLDWWRGWWWW